MSDAGDTPGNGENGGRDHPGDGPGWPIALHGVTETVVTTLGPNDRWNAAALGIRGEIEAGQTAPVAARTWDRTRTRRNFEHRGEGYVQFVDNPLLFVETALGIEEREEPVLAEAAAWVCVEVERRAEGESDGTEWVDWEVRPVESAVERLTVPTIDRGFNAVIEATVWVSRLDVEGYDRAELETRLDFLEDVARTCGGEHERAAFERLWELALDQPSEE